MSSNSTLSLALWLEGPLQSWGFEDRFNRRKTGLLPTKSALIGLCCAALGADRGSPEEQHWLPRLNDLQLLSVAVTKEQQRPVRRMEDFHTVQNTRTADGKTKETHITHRSYLNDAAFAVVFTGDSDLVSALASALADPVWGIWLGRKACIPSRPIVTTDPLYPDEAAALESLLGGRSLEQFLHQRESADFAAGTDTLMDTPVTFADPRQFAPRRVHLERGNAPGDA